MLAILPALFVEVSRLRDRPGPRLCPSLLSLWVASPRALHKPARGTAELVGTSTRTTVSVIAAGPLTLGVTYEFWCVGHDHRADGPVEYSRDTGTSVNS